MIDLKGKIAAVYLRKSRAEEGMLTEEVLSHHRAMLQECAQKHGVIIEDSYEEVVSGESLYARPQMLRLLEEVESGKYEAVLCMDLDRLSRGRMKDQGIVLDAFRESGTLIVTPEKVYDLADDVDDELAEFKTFMSRREYKIINKRLRRGLMQTIKDGAYVANAPYGYRKVTIGKTPTLEIVPEEAEIVRLMFQLYADGHGCVSVANHVNALGAKPHRIDRFTRSSINMILRNPVYIGKISWNKRTHIKKNTKGNQKHITIYNPKESWTVCDGRHPPIIEQELFDKVQSIFEKKYRPAYNDGTIQSPLASLVFCGKCGAHVQRATMQGTPYLLCQRKGCCASVKFEFAEERVLEHLQEELDRLNLKLGSTERPSVAPFQAMLTNIEKEISTTIKQKAKLHELLETGVYDIQTYKERMAVVMGKAASLETAKGDVLSKIEKAEKYNPARQAEQIRTVLAAYADSDPAARNALLHSVIEKIIYFKEKKSKPKDFHLELEMKSF